MTDKVVGLRGATPHTEAVPEVVEVLRDLLARAEAGEIQAFAYALARRHGDGFATGWDGNAGTRDHLAASIGHLQHRFFSQAYDNG